ncbi:hypothetical protein HJC23_012116 [Cyclotella cryptica]|uniref:RecA family profile 1 domain-containing protein n=1 Tax=Cyclotella cryptica TaxID=29204 RepID=A0ABD3NSK5_9STRA|eukprot:CCRYP_020166-RB/>CCRYP_020166-RB protein AED:0.03 eAED:0.03 QI:200/1/1/1/0.5/0.33/3/98/796
MHSSIFSPCCPLIAGVLTSTLNVNRASAFPIPSTFVSSFPQEVLLSSAHRIAMELHPHSTFLLKAFSGRNGENHSNDDDDDDTYDDEPPELSLSPQEFIYKMQQNYKSDGGNGPVPSSIPSFGMVTPRSKSRSRPAFSSNKTSRKDTATVYLCTNCNAEYLQWRGRCGTCQEWNTIQEFRANRKRSSFGSSDEMGGLRPLQSKPTRKTFQKSGSSWLDGVGVDSCGFFRDDGGGGPVRLTDVYGEIIPTVEGNNTRWKEAYHNGYREERTQVPGDPEMNAVLGGGIMPGSLTLVGGDPGVSKSTLLLQMAGSIASLSERSVQFQGIGMGPPKPSPTTSPEPDSNSQFQQKHPPGGPVLYISGEENANQIASRALRLGIEDPELLLWCETDADTIADTVVSAIHGDQSLWDDSVEGQRNTPPVSRPPSLIVIDSIQTMTCEAAGASAAGGITQVRECVGLFLRLAKSTGVPIILVGHVTKSGDVAGPRTIEHMVDCVLYLEGGGLIGGDDGMSSLRILRAAKNRFGSSEEVGVYQMDCRCDGRLVPVSDPSSLFLATRQDNDDLEGCAISVVLEGIRSMTVEVQALVSFSAGSGAYNGRRVVDGISTSRLLLILAVLQKRYGISFHRQDVYVNVVGGLHLGKGSKSGGGSDLSVVVAVVSSLLGIPVRSDTAFVGEIGLLGELRQVHSLEKRVSEARRMGFSRIVTPLSMKKSSRKVSGPREISAGGITQIMCDNVLDAINCGLVKSLPTIRTSSGPKLRKPTPPDQKPSKDISNNYYSLGMDNVDIILDDSEDENS